MSKNDQAPAPVAAEEQQVRVEHEGSHAINMSLSSAKHNRQDISRFLGRLSIEHETMIMEQIERLRAEGKTAGVNIYIGLTAVIEKQ